MIQDVLASLSLKILSNMADYDHMDCPAGNFVAPASVRKHAANVYYAIDLEPPIGLIPPLLDNEALRAACATGSGLVSVGINPQELAYHAMPPELVAVANALLQWVKSLGITECKFDCFNSAAVKLYLSKEVLQVST